MYIHNSKPKLKGSMLHQASVMLLDLTKHLRKKPWWLWMTTVLPFLKTWSRQVWTFLNRECGYQRGNFSWIRNVYAWQRDTPKVKALNYTTFSNRSALHTPDTITDIIPASNRGTIEGPGSGTFIVVWFTWWLSISYKTSSRPHGIHHDPFFSEANLILDSM